MLSFNFHTFIFISQYELQEKHNRVKNRLERLRKHQDHIETKKKLVETLVLEKENTRIQSYAKQMKNYEEPVQQRR